MLTTINGALHDMFRQIKLLICCRCCCCFLCDAMHLTMQKFTGKKLMSFYGSQAGTRSCRGSSMMYSTDSNDLSKISQRSSWQSERKFGKVDHIDSTKKFDRSDGEELNNLITNAS